MPSWCNEDGSYLAAFGLASPLSRCFPLPKNAFHIPSQRRGRPAAPTADIPRAKAWHSRTSLTFWLHPPWQCGEAAWAGCVPAGWRGREKEGPCRGCSSPSYLPLPGAVGLRGHRRVQRNTAGTLAGLGMC